jgi:hypothetical protein
VLALFCKKVASSFIGRQILVLIIKITPPPPQRILTINRIPWILIYLLLLRQGVAVGKCGGGNNGFYFFGWERHMVSSTDLETPRTHKKPGRVFCFCGCRTCLVGIAFLHMVYTSSHVEHKQSTDQWTWIFLFCLNHLIPLRLFVYTNWFNLGQVPLWADCLSHVRPDEVACLDSYIKG